jgi:hypothetical protein
VLEYQRLAKIRAITRQAELVKKKNAPAAKKSFKKNKFSLASLLFSAILSPDMKKLYTLTLQNKQGEIRNEEVAALSLTHAMERLQEWGGLSEADKLKNFTCVPLDF